MSLPHNTNGDDELVRYVLGLLPDEAAERLDEASIADEEVAARLRDVETDLLDSYARGQLVGPTRERFELYYLMSPRRRENVMVAARFIRALDRLVPREEAATWKDRIARPTMVTRFAAAAALVVVVSGILLFRAGRPLDEPSPASSNRVVSRPTHDEGKQPTGQRASVEPPGGSRDIRRSTPGERMVSMVLPPPTRSLSPVPTLVIPAGANRIAFELQLESNDFPSYRVKLENPVASDILWRSDWMSARASGDQASVSVVIPASLLGPQHYALDLTGRSVDGRLEVMGRYTVRIAEP